MLVRDIDADGFVRFNEAFGQQVGFSPQELRERPFVDWIVDDDRASALAVMQGDRSACAFRHRTHDGQHIHLVLKMSSPMLLAHSPMSTQSVSPNGALDDTVKGTLAIIANIVEEQNPEYRCSILLVKDGRFVRGAGPSLPESYNDAIDGYPIGPTVGSCGTAIFWNVPVIVSDIQKDPLWIPFADLAETAGVAACWSHPFTNSNGVVLGALALYASEPRSPTAEQMGRLKAAAQMTGLAVERGRAEEALREQRKRKLLLG